MCWIEKRHRMKHLPGRAPGQANHPHGNCQQPDLVPPDAAALQRLGQNKRKSLETEFAAEGRQSQQDRAQREQNDGQSARHYPNRNEGQQQSGRESRQKQTDFFNDERIHALPLAKVPAATKISSSVSESQRRSSGSRARSSASNCSRLPLARISSSRPD